MGAGVASDPTPPGIEAPARLRRVIIERITPSIDGGRFWIKRSVGESVTVEGSVFLDGHDSLSAVLKYRRHDEKAWTEVPLEALGNDRWRAVFPVADLGLHHYTIEGWVDHFKTWRRDLRKKVDAGLDVELELREGAAWIRAAAGRAPKEDSTYLKTWADGITDGRDIAERVDAALDDQLDLVMRRYPDRSSSTEFEPALPVMVEPVRARFGAWYEMFPRSFSPEPGKHGTFRDCESQLERISAMGFDVLYLPPIHPIGKTFRKGRNNRPMCEQGEPGSPWGIGSAEGGHKAIHPDLGTLEDFKRFVAKAKSHGIDVALDVAFQCSPDHPYVTEHPEWFKQRPDGSIQYAENPPKKYQDIYPIHFETSDWRALYVELKSVFEYWIEQGIWIFRVDNPHTKALPFWEWVIRELKADHPELILLSEAFTRPKVMYYLAKIGFPQSYNYFPWRNTKAELEEYFTELTRTEVREFFRPNIWPNTPDILTQYLQYGGRAGFIARFVLASTLGASYGIYGPAFELCDHIARELGSEEYLDSEKYQIKQWNLDAPGNLRELIAQVNQVRRNNPALQANENLHFHQIDNEEIIAYSKHSENRNNIILVFVNVDPHHVQSGWTDLSLDLFDIDPEDTFQVHDLLSGARYHWTGPRNYVELNPEYTPAHIFRIRRKLRKEKDFDYFS